MERYEEVRVIGRGNYGVAVLATDKETKEQVVVKKIAIEGMSDEEKAQAKQEVVLLSSLHHPCIVEYKTSFFQDSCLHIVMQYCEEGDLATKIKAARKTGKHFDEGQILDWFSQLVFAVSYIHKHRVLHRDLKSQNVFLTKDNMVRLGDFGIAKVLEHTLDAAKTVVGTPYYMAPEICQGKSYNEMSDMWALGCVLYEMATLNHAFQASNLLGLVYAIVQTKQADLPSYYSTELSALVDKMLSKEAADRYTAAELLELPIISKRLALMANAAEETTVGRRTPVYFEVDGTQNGGSRETSGADIEESTTFFHASPPLHAHTPSTRVASGSDRMQVPTRLPSANRGERLQEADLAETPSYFTFDSYSNSTAARAGDLQPSLSPARVTSSAKMTIPSARGSDSRGLPVNPMLSPPGPSLQPTHLPPLRELPKATAETVLLESFVGLAAPPSAASTPRQTSLSSRFRDKQAQDALSSIRQPALTALPSSDMYTPPATELPEEIEVPEKVVVDPKLNFREKSFSGSGSSTPRKIVLAKVAAKSVNNRRPHTANVLIPPAKAPSFGGQSSLGSPSLLSPGFGVKPVVQRVSRKAREGYAGEAQRPWTVSHSRGSTLAMEPLGTSPPKPQHTEAAATAMDACVDMESTSPIMEEEEEVTVHVPGRSTPLLMGVPVDTERYSDGFDSDSTPHGKSPAVPGNVDAEVHNIISNGPSRGTRSSRTSSSSEDSVIRAVAREVADVSGAEALGLECTSTQEGAGTLRAIVRVYLTEKMGAGQAVQQLREWKDPSFAPAATAGTGHGAYDDIRREYVSPLLHPVEPIPTPKLIRGDRGVATARDAAPPVYTRSRVEQLKQVCRDRLGVKLYDQVYNFLRRKQQEEDAITSPRFYAELIAMLGGRKELLEASEDLSRAVFMETIVEASEKVSPPSKVPLPKLPPPAMEATRSSSRSGVLAPHVHSSGLAFRSRSEAKLRGIGFR